MHRLNQYPVCSSMRSDVLVEILCWQDHIIHVLDQFLSDILRKCLSFSLGRYQDDKKECSSSTYEWKYIVY